MTNEELILNRLESIEKHLSEGEKHAITEAGKDIAKEWSLEYVFKTLIEWSTENARELLRVVLEALLLFIVTHSMLFILILIISAATVAGIVFYRREERKSKKWLY